MDKYSPTFVQSVTRSVLGIDIDILLLQQQLKRVQKQVVVIIVLCGIIATPLGRNPSMDCHSVNLQVHAEVKIHARQLAHAVR